jgi:hypothetical protein
MPVDEEAVVLLWKTTRYYLQRELEKKSGVSYIVTYIYVCKMNILWRVFANA